MTIRWCNLQAGLRLTWRHSICLVLQTSEWSAQASEQENLTFSPLTSFTGEKYKIVRRFTNDKTTFFYEQNSHWYFRLLLPAIVYWLVCWRLDVERVRSASHAQTLQRKGESYLNRKLRVIECPNNFSPVQVLHTQMLGTRYQNQFGKVAYLKQQLDHDRRNLQECVVVFTIE